ncbi:unnamed protein product, partial [Staurois parvus]
MALGRKVLTSGAIKGLTVCWVHSLAIQSSVLELTCLHTGLSPVIDARRSPCAGGESPAGTQGLTAEA